MEKLKFTQRVLGPKASRRLLNKEVTQTFRGDESRNLKRAQTVEVTLDGERVGDAVILSLDALNFNDLDIDDVRRGGFDNRLELGSALRRAGFRFRPITAYALIRVRFSWRHEDTAKVQAATPAPSLKAEVRKEI